MKKVLVICGGKSTEHEVSIVSAKNVVAVMNRLVYEILVVAVSRSGTWYLTSLEHLCTMKECRDHVTEGSLCSLVCKHDEVVLLTENGEEFAIDVVFPLMHGAGGEDGAIQGLLDFVHVPYVGCGVAPSILAYDKDLTKRILSIVNVPFVPYLVSQNIQRYPSYESASHQLASPILFVKPATSGSSVGVSKVNSSDTYELAVRHAFQYARKVIIEKYIPGRELECSVLGNDDPEASCVGEVVPGHEFYSYEAKYIDYDKTGLFIPAPIPDNIAANVRALAIKAYKALDCRGMARVDFFLGANGEVYLNELNTIPGFTNISMYPKLWQESGIAYSELIDRLIKLALEDYEAKRQLLIHPDIN